MEAAHELGHVIGAGGHVTAVHVPIIGFSMTEYPDGAGGVLAIAAGPLLGSLLPLPLLLAGRATLIRRMLWFVPGFCLIANGAYLLAGALLVEGDAGDLIHLGVPRLAIVPGAALALAAGLWIWHANGRWIGLTWAAAPPERAASERSRQA